MYNILYIYRSGITTMLFCFTCLSVLLAQKSSDYYFKNLTTINGLSQNSINYIIQDNQGMVWMATQAGIDKYTGSEVMRVEGFVKSLTEIVTYIYDWDDEYILASTTEKTRLINKWNLKDTKTMSNAPTNIIHMSRIGKDTLMVFTDHDIYYADRNLKRLGGNPILMTIDDQKNKIQSVASSKHVWYVATQKGIARFDRQKDKRFNEVSDFREMNITSLCFAPDSSTIYCGSVRELMYTYTTSTGKRDLGAMDVVDDVPPAYKIKALLFDHAGLLWVGTSHTGLYIFDTSGDNLSMKANFRANSIRHAPVRFSSNNINYLYQTKENVMWVGTEAGGVNYWRPGRYISRHLLSIKMAHQNEEILKGNYVWAIHVTDGGKTLLAGLNGNGIAKIDLTSEPEHVNGWIKPMTNGPFSGIVYTIVEKDGLYYFATRDGIYTTQSIADGAKYSLLQSRSGTPILKEEIVSVLCYASTEKKWYAGFRGGDKIHVFNEQFENYSYIKLAKPSEELSFVKSLPNFTLVGTNMGLYRIGQDGRQISPLEYLPRDTFHFTCVLQQGDSILWLGTDRNGLFRCDLRTNQNILIGKDCSLMAEVIYDLSMDRWMDLWLSTNHGLYRYNSTLGFNHFEVGDGLGVLEYNAGASYILGDSTLFFGGINGFDYVRPMPINPSQPYFRPVIRHLHASEDTIISVLNFNQLLNKGVDPIYLPYKFGYLSILPPVLGDYLDASNNQFILEFNGAPIVPSSDGGYIISENNVRVWRENILLVSYRAGGSGKWNKLQIIPIKRQANWPLIGFFGLLLGTILLVFLHYMSGKRLRVVHEKINEVSRLETTHGVCEMALKHLVNDIGFSYAAISLVDFDNRRIAIVDAYDETKTKAQIEKWKSFSCYPLDSEDILAQTVAAGIDGEYVMVSRNKVISNKNIKRSDKLFNKNVVDNFDHDKLTRIFMPMVHRAKSHIDGTENADTVLGVIEVGLDTSFFRGKNLVNFQIPAALWLSGLFDLSNFFKNQQTELKLYVDNLSQPYLKAYTKERKKDMYRFIEDLEKQCDKEKGDHERFLEIVLKGLTEKIGADYGDISLMTFNSEKINFKDHSLFYGVEKSLERQYDSVLERRNLGKKGIINHVVETKNYYIADDVNKDDKYIEIFPGITSELALPMQLNDSSEVIGVVNFLSQKGTFFNQVLASIYIKGCKRLTELYIQKKQYHAIRAIKTPVDIVSQTEDQFYQSIVSSLRAFFKSDYISIWRRKHSKEDQKGRLFYICPKATIPSFYEEYNKMDFMEATIKKDYTQIKNGTLLEVWTVDNLQNTNSRIYRFCNQQHLSFKGYIVLKVVVDDEFQAFINVFSRRKINVEEIQGYAGALLDEVSKKAALAIQHIRLSQSMEIISDSLRKGGDENPQSVIVEQAYRMSPSAHSVVLYAYQKGRPILVGDAIIGGKEPPEIKDDPNRSVVFANFIIEEGTKYLSNEYEFNRVLKMASKGGLPNRESFWHRFKLKSVAVIRLDYNKEPVGVMFFNYTEAKNFEQGSGTRDFIDAFTNFATIALINEEFIHRIQDEREKLGVEITRLEVEQVKLSKEKEEQKNVSEQLQFKYDDVYRKMEEMMPRVTKASYYMIMQGINHDIRNFFLKIGKILRNLNEDTNISATHKNKIGPKVNQVNHIITNIQNLLTLFEYKKEVKKEFISIVDVVYGVKYFFEGQDNGITIYLNYTINNVSIYGLKEEFSMVIYNLLNNAVYAIQSKGPNAEGKILISISEFNDLIKIIVKDDGIGMEKKTLEQIFDLGFSTKEKEGLGIGLFFVNEVIKDSFNGNISADSVKGEGTTFTILIPNKK